MTRSTARSVALDVLERVEVDGAYANLALGAALDRSELSARDRGFATELVYGTTRMRRACDVMVDRFVTTPPDPPTRRLLRLGAYQLAFADVAPHAAVSETVNLAPRRTRGFVNAILRRVAESSSDVAWPSPWAELSYPDWLGERVVAELGEKDGLAALAAMNAPPPVSVRADGYVQDQASQWVAAAVEAQRGERVADVCAAPGGKTTAIAATGAVVAASDVSASRIGLVVENAQRLGGSLTVVVADATAPPYPVGAFDAVLIDAPCSGLGALRRRPDARWRIGERDIETLADLQRSILVSSATLVGPGGRLVYSVCTLTAAESVDHPTPDGFEIDDAPPPVGFWRPYRQGWRVLPQDADTDGMTLLRFRRSSSAIDH